MGDRMTPLDHRPRFVGLLCERPTTRVPVTSLRSPDARPCCSTPAPARSGPCNARSTCTELDRHRVDPLPSRITGSSCPVLRNVFSYFVDAGSGIPVRGTAETDGDDTRRSPSPAATTHSVWSTIDSGLDLRDRGPGLERSPSPITRSRPSAPTDGRRRSSGSCSPPTAARGGRSAITSSPMSIVALMDASHHAWTLEGRGHPPHERPRSGGAGP